jgi:putative ABC transport system permease protein
MIPSHRIPLAWKNLTHDRRRLSVAISGIGFAVVLMFMQTGFKNALFDSTVQILQELNADLVLIAKARYALPANQTFAISRIYEAKECAGVRAAYPLYIERPRAVWKQPDGRGLPIRVLACDPSDPVLLLPEVAQHADALKQQGAVLIDEKNKSVYGPPGPRVPWNQWQGVTLASRSIQLVGAFRLGTDFANDGNLFMNLANFAKFFPSRAAPGRDPLEVVDLGVVQLEKGADPQEVKRLLMARLPDDVAVFTKTEMIERERNFWSRSTPIGYIFLVGTVIGFLVGMIICYQIINADIADHMPEFATLKAMGYRNRYFVGFVLMESVYLSLLSFLPGTLVSLGLYEALAHSTGLLMILNVPRAASVLLLTLAMCVASGCLAMRKVLAADPAELF